MIATEIEVCNCDALQRTAETGKEKSPDNQELCANLCVSILEGIVQGYENLKTQNPNKLNEFDKKINHLKKQIQLQELDKKLIGKFKF
jgi:hypothetical protein